MSLADESLPEPASPGDAPEDPGAVPASVDPQVHASGTQRAGWSSLAEPAYDRRTRDRRLADRRAGLRRIDDTYQPTATRRAEEARPTGRPMAPPDSAAGAGRLLALLLVIIVAFAGGVAVDQAAWRGTLDGASVPVVTHAPGGSGAVLPPATSRPATSSDAATSSPAPTGTAALGATPQVTAGPTIGPGATVPPYAPANIGILWEALTTIQDHWVRRDSLNATDLTYGLLNGLVDALGDPGHTVFLTPDQVRSESESLSGQITGIGVYLGVLGAAPFIQSVVSGSPAARAGVLPGDRLIAIDGTSAENLSVDEIGRLVRGRAGTTVTLTLLHPQSDAPVEVTITRALITVPAISWTMIPGTAFADIRIGEFSSGTTEQFVTALRGARQSGAQGIVLDLRNNPGGYVHDAVGVASQLLAEGTVYVRRTADGTEISVPIRPGGIATDLPLVVLVNYGSASSAEITAGAIQDNQRGQLVGTRTYGTGTVLNTFGLRDGSAVRLGVEEWLTPSGRAIFPGGIRPDQEVDLASDQRALEPDTIRMLTADEFRVIADDQMLRAIQILGAS